VFATHLAYLATLVTLSAEHFLTPKPMLGARLSGGVGEYFEKAARVSGQFDWREDLVAAVTLGIDDQIPRWLAVSADYTHARQDPRSGDERGPPPA
jgi:hypothetical protein